MTTTMFPTGALAAQASEEREIKSTLTEGVTEVDIGAGETVCFSFIPDESGLYRFFTDGEEDTFGSLFDADWNELYSDDYGIDGYGFHITYSLISGQEYYLEIKYYDEKDSGKVSLTAERGLSGECGASVTYEVDDEGKLTIDGTGRMDDYYNSPYLAPWYSGRQYISYAEITGSVENIGGAAFSDCSNLTEVKISDGVSEIGDGVFAGCSSLRKISIPASVTSIKDYAFEDSSNLVIIGYAGTEAERYADQKNITFKIIGEDDVVSSGTLYEGEKEISIEAGETVYYSFTPEEDGDYTIYSKGGNDTYGSLYDADSIELASDDDSGAGRNFMIQHYLDADQEYYVGVRFYDSDQSGTVIIAVQSGTVEIGTYTITYESGYGYFYNDEGERVTELSYQIEEGDYLYNIPEIQKDNSLKRNFVGWAMDPDGNEFIDDIYNYYPTGDMTFYAVFGEEGYAITFDAGDGYFEEDGTSVKTWSGIIEKGQSVGSLYYPSPEMDAASHKVFAGWTTDPAGENITDLWELIPTEDTTFYAVWEDAWTITFDASEGYFNGDQSQKTVMYNIRKGGSPYSVPEDPEIDVSSHKAFAGWATDPAGENIIDVWELTPTEDIVLYAAWGDAWTITLDAGEGNFYGDESQKTTLVNVLKGKSLGSVSLSEPWIDESSGKMFAGWSEDPNGNTVIDLYEYVPTEDCVLYAVWEKAYRITFYYSDYEESSMIIKAGSAIGWIDNNSFKIEEMAASGKAFAGWATDEDRQDIVEDIENYVPEADMAFYAVWRDAWTITYDAGEGYLEYEDDNASYTVVVEKGKPLNEGYNFRNGEYNGKGWIPETGIDDSYAKVFSCWAEDEAGKNKIEDIEHFVPEKDMTIYAIWEDAWTITFDMGEGYDPDTRMVVSKKGDTLKGKYPWINGNQISHKVFTGWALDAAGEQMVSEETFIPDGNLTLYAIWEDAWTITFKSEENSFYDAEAGMGGGYTSSLIQKVIKGEPIGIFGDYGFSSRVFDRYGAQMVLVRNPESKVLAGWSTEENGGDFIESLVGFIPDRDMTFYAVWRDAWTVTFDAGDGYVQRSHKVSDPEKCEVLKGNSIGENITAEDSDSNKAFAGWSTSENGTDLIDNIRDYIPKSNITLYAVWKDAYTIKFDINGQDRLLSYFYIPDDVKVAKGYTMKYAPAYYLQNGSENKVIFWSTDPQGNNIIQDLKNYVPTGDITLYAIAKDAYELTFNANGGYFIDSEKAVITGEYTWLHTITWNTEKHFIPKGGSVSDLPAFMYAQIGRGKYEIDNELREIIPEPQSLNNVFKGWATDPEGKHMVSNVETYKPAGNVTLYAIWGENSVSEIQLNKTELKLEEGTSSQLEATVLPESAAASGVTWTSSNKGIATVDEKGLVKAIKAGTAVITASAADGSGVTASCTVTVSKHQKTGWIRLAGNGRYDTMAAIVGEGFNQTGGTVVVATGTGFKDALAAAGLAGLYDAPVILTDGKTLSAKAQEQLKRLSPSRVYIAGGEAAVSKNVFNSIQTVTGVKPNRCFGQTSAGTSAALATAGSGWSDTAIIATNKTFKDALSAAPISYSLHMPILLADNGKSLNADVLNALKTCKIKNVIIVGGKLAVTENVENQLIKNGISKSNISRIAGNTAVDTSADIATYGLSHGMTINGMGVATSQNYPDALAGAALCGHNNSVLVLADDKAMKNTSFPKKYKADFVKGYVFGGILAVSDNVVKALEAAVK